MSMQQTRSEKAAQERKERLEKYFTITPDPGDNTKALALLAGAGAAVLIALIAFVGGSGFLGVVGLVAAVWAGVKGIKWKSAYDRAFAAAEPKPRDDEMDVLLAADLTTIVDRALARLGLSVDDIEFVPLSYDPIANLSSGAVPAPRNTGGPMLVFGPMFPCRAMIGGDDVWRFSAYGVMVICPTGYHLAMYRCALDFLTGGLRQEETQEYHYADVVAVSTTSTPGPELTADTARGRVDDRIRFAKTVLREFEIVVASGDRSKIVVGISDENDPEREANLQDSNIDDVIGSVRRMLREKKGGVVSRPPRSAPLP